MKESELAAKIVRGLLDDAWEVYQEVAPFYCGQVADIVAVRANRIWVIETKMSLSLAVIEQAEWWKYYAHWVSCGVPAPSRRLGLRNNNRGRHMAERVARWLGLGLLEVDGDGVGNTMAPSLNRHAKVEHLRNVLSDEHKTYAAAGTKQGYWTPFKRTCRDVTKYVADHPGCNLKDAIAAVDHHYGTDSTAKACLAKFIGTALLPLAWIDGDRRKGLSIVAAEAANESGETEAREG